MKYILYCDILAVDYFTVPAKQSLSSSPTEIMVRCSALLGDVFWWKLYELVGLLSQLFAARMNQRLS